MPLRHDNAYGYEVLKFRIIRIRYSRAKAFKVLQPRKFARGIKLDLV